MSSKLQYQPFSLDVLGTTDAKRKNLERLTFSFKQRTLDNGAHEALQGNVENAESVFMELYQADTNEMQRLFYVTFGELIDSLGDEQSNQFDVSDTLVYKFLTAAPNGFLLTDTLLEDIHVGYLKENIDAESKLPYEGVLPVVVSGRHRLVGILTAFHLAGYDVNSEAFRNIAVRVTPFAFQNWEEIARAIETRNGSRSMTPSERKNVRVQLEGVDPSSLSSIVHYATEGGVGRLSTAFDLGLIQAMKESEEALPADLKDTTIGRIGSSFASAFKSSATPQVKKFLDSPEFVKNLLDAAANELPKVIDTFTRKGVSNYARESTAIARALATVITERIDKELKREASKKANKASTVEAPTPPVEQPEQPTEETAPKATKKGGRKSSKATKDADAATQSA